MLNQNNEDIIKKLKKAASRHKIVRDHIKNVIKPGMKIIDVANILESKNRELNTDSNNLNQGIGFPTGISINNCAAHFTPTMNDQTIIDKNDVIKIDFGCHEDGWIIDSAFTHTFDKKYDELLKASKEATYQGIKSAGVDARLGEIGRDIEEVINSYQLEINGKTYDIKPVRNLGGHNIQQYTIHAGKYIPCIGINDNTKMEEGEIYAVETFATTGSGVVREFELNSHFMKNKITSNQELKLNKSKKLLGYINKTFSGLPFCDKWLSNDNKSNYHKLAMDELVSKNIIKTYPPLYDINNSYISQFEHTIFLKPSSKIILSKGKDY